MPPDAGIHIEIAVMQTRPVLIPPKEQGHGRGGFGANQFANLSGQIAAFGIKGMHGNAQEPRLHFPGAHRGHGIAADKGPGQIGTAADGRKPEV